MNSAGLALIFGILTHAIAQQSQDVITLERTSCYGPCPVYSLRIDSSGNADETGWTDDRCGSSPASRGIDAAGCGARPDQGDRHGNTALIGAAAVRFSDFRMVVEVLRSLLANGASVDATNDLGESALMWAAKAGSPEAIDLLLKAGANPRRTDQSGQDALFYLRRARNNLTFDKALVRRYERAASVLEQSLNPAKQ